MDSLPQSNNIDALLWPGAKWPSNTITYSFMPSIPEIYKAAATGLAATIGVPVAWAILGTEVVEQATFTPFNNIQRGATEKALNLWAEVADIQFEQKEDKILQLADILDLGIIESFLKGIGQWDEFADALDDYIGNFIGFPVVEGANIRFGSIANPNSNSPGLGIPPLLTNALAIDQIRQTIADWIDDFIEPLDKLGAVPSAINLLELTSIKPYPFGDIWLNSTNESVSSSDISNWSEGGEGFETLLHEIGHALGLKHPGNYDAGGFTPPSPFLPKTEDSVQYTIMSYDYRNADPNIQRVRTAHPLTPMLYDIAAIQKLYGANFSTRSDDTTYFWNDPDSPFWKDPTKPFMMTIWDGGGIDTISAANQTRDAEINLNAGQFSSIGPLNKTYFFDIKKNDYLRDSTGNKLEDPQEKYNLAIAFGVTIENAIGGTGNDTLIGNDVNNVLQGGDSDDSLEGRGGADDLQGEDGNDTINSGSGYDTVDGGSGIDTLVVDYSSATSGISWGFYDSYSRSSGYVSDYYGGNQVYYYNIEQFQITGGAYNDTLYGAALDDSLNGGAGNDTITKGSGVDFIDGGTGIDILTDADFSSETTNMVFDDVSTHAPLTLINGTTITNIELFDNLSTGSGNDTISFTGNRNDNIKTGAGNDTINSGLGYDQVDGGTGIDTLVVDYSSAMSGIYWGFYDSYGRSSGYVSASGVSQVVYSNMEQFDITGTAYNDQLYGAALNDSLIGGAGNDTIDGGVGNDTLNGGAGNDTITKGSGVDFIDGGTGIDILTDADFSSVTTNLVFDDVSTHNPIVLANGTTITNIELFDNLSTGSGNDTISLTGNRNDNIKTGEGNDTINSGTGYDTVDGGSGIDTLVVDYSSATSGINWGFYDSYGRSSGYVYGYSGVSQVTFYNIEQFHITGSAYNETLYGAAGNDSLNGGAGNDTISKSSGVDTIDGGAGIDILTDADFSSETTNMVFDDVSTHAPITLANGTTISNIELFDNLSTGSGNDTISFTGKRSDNIKTGAGNDSINSGLGADTVDGGSGIDTLVVDYSSATSGINWGFYDSYGRSSGYVYDYSGVGQVTFYNIEQFDITGGAGNDTLYGAALSDSLIGGAGNDTLIGGLGRDQLTGGAGADRFYFYTRTEGIDTITDFNVVDDAIYISSSFGGGLTAGEAITTAQFTLGSGASDSSDRFIYNQSTGALFFDADGTGLSRQTQIAQLSTGLVMSNQDIIVFA